MLPAANDPVEARKLYLLLVKRHHPDLCGPENREIATALTQQINAAWDAKDIIKLREIETHGTGFLAWQAERQNWAKEAELARERARREAMRRQAVRQQEETVVMPEQPEEEATWGPRPAFSHVETGGGIFASIFLFANPWNPCANWVVSGDYLTAIRYLVQLAIIAAWSCAGVWLFQIAGHARTSGGWFRGTEGILGQVAGLVLAISAFARLLRVALVPTATLIGALLCAWLVSLVLRMLPGGIELAYGTAIGCWIYGFWLRFR